MLSKVQMMAKEGNCIWRPLAHSTVHTSSLILLMIFLMFLLLLLLLVFIFIIVFQLCVFLMLLFVQFIPFTTLVHV